MHEAKGIDFFDAADSAPALVWLSNADKSGSWFNQRWLHYTGRLLEQEQGAGWTEGIHPDDRERYLDSYARACEDGRPFEIEFRLRQAGGSYGWIADACTPQPGAQGKPAGYLHYGWDITAHKQTEQALQESALHTQAILDNALDGIVTIDGRGMIHSFNRAAVGIFGYAAKDVIGRNVNMLMPEPYRSQHDGYLENYRATGVPRIIGIGREVEGRRKDGTVFPMELAVSQILRKGHPMFVGLVRDITERKRVERMKSEFISTVSHELRTPLTSISGALSLLASGKLGELPEKARQMVEIANTNSHRLTRLINNLLDMEQLADGKMRLDMRMQPLMPLVEQSLESIQIFAAQNQVSCKLGERSDQAQVLVDGMRLQQVLANFLANAVKFSPKGGKVEIAVIRREGAVRMEVSDQGPGIPKAFHARIFQRFSQADASDTRPAEGSGLGLAISKELAESMGGTVGFSSEEGKGARFHIELPMIETAQAAQTPAAAATQGAPT